MSDPERAVLLEAYVRNNLYDSWNRLHNAHRWTNRNNGVARMDRPWSMQCDSLAEDIREATDLVGPVNLNHIGMSMMVSGWFTWVVAKIGLVDQHVPSEEFLAECRNLMRRNHLT